MGGDKGSGTRSSLMWNTVDIVKAVKPKIVLWENVKNLISKKHKHNFDAYIEIMDELGYNSYWKVLNAKDYGIPQNRERVFTVSIRKDIDHNIFEFPKPYSLEKRLKDFLEPHVDEKYYLSEKMIQYISFTGTKNFKNPDCRINLDIARPLTTDQGKRAGTTNYISEELPDNFDLQNECLKIKEKTKKGYTEAQDGDGVYINRPEQKRGVVQKGMIQTLKTSPDVGVVVASAMIGREKGQQIELSDREYANAITTVQKDSLVAEKSLWTEQQAKMITEDGNIRRYVDSDKIDEFKEGQCADISFPNGYNKGPRVHDECPAINTTTTKSSFVVKVPLKRGYSVELFPESEDTTEIDIIGNYSKSDYNATPIVGKNGVAPTVRENHGQVTAVTTKNKRIQKIVEDNDLSDKDPSFLDIYNQKVIPNESGTLKAGMDHQQGNIIYNQLRIRKLTPKECYRLMGFSDEDFEKASKFNSNSQLYKQAGNSIVVNVLEAIFGMMLDEGNNLLV